MNISLDYILNPLRNEVVKFLFSAFSGEIERKMLQKQISLCFHESNFKTRCKFFMKPIVKSMGENYFLRRLNFFLKVLVEFLARKCENVLTFFSIFCFIFLSFCRVKKISCFCCWVDLWRTLWNCSFFNLLFNLSISHLTSSYPKFHPTLLCKNF